MIVNKDDEQKKLPGLDGSEKFILEGDGKAKVEVIHPEWHIDVKVSNDNTKGERRCTVHIRSDGDVKKAVEEAIKAYKDGLTN